MPPEVLDGWIAATPQSDPDSESFWEAAQDLRFVAQRCTECATLRFPPSALCSSCHCWSFEWTELPHVGTIHSWIVVCHATSPELADKVPYVVALVDVAPGVRVPGRLLGSDGGDLSAQTAVELVFISSDGGRRVPAFVGAGTPSTLGRWR